MEGNRPYRFGFVLSTGGGNLTRYTNLKKYTERDPEVESLWTTNPGYIDPDPLRWLPQRLHRRTLPMRLAAPVMRRIASLDAIMFHAFEPYVYAAARSLLSSRPALVWSQDDPPTADPSFWEGYGVVGRSRWRARARWTVDGWCARRAALLLPFSSWAATVLIAQTGVPAARVHAVPVGVDLELWPHPPPRHERTGLRPKILFVGGNFLRKGGDLLIDVFAQRFSGCAELHLVTHEPPARLPPNAFAYGNLHPGDPRLQQLFAMADLFVLPTRADLSPNAVIEAMASGLPVIATRLHGIPEMVQHGDTGFLLPPDDTAALAESMHTLLGNPEQRREMGLRGRRLVERSFSAAVNVPRILALMKHSAAGIRTRHHQPGR
jgi:glycosyltransferase involved in cell wall biosynthesis